jgi:hypothetical protein
MNCAAPLEGFLAIGRHKEAWAHRGPPISVGPVPKVSYAAQMAAQYATRRLGTLMVVAAAIGLAVGLGVAFSFLRFDLVSPHQFFVLTPKDTPQRQVR